MWAELVSGDVAPGAELVTLIQPPQRVLEERAKGSLFAQPQRGGGMTPAGEVPLPTLQRGGPPRGKG